MITALITSRNKPKVMMVAGRVRNIKMGLIVTLSNANKAATINEVVKELTLTPERISASTKTTTAVKRIWMISFMLGSFYCLTILKLLKNSNL